LASKLSKFRANDNPFFWANALAQELGNKQLASTTENLHPTWRLKNLAESEQINRFLRAVHAVFACQAGINSAVSGEA